MTSRKTAQRPSTAKVKKLALKKEKLADLSPRAREADALRGQGTTTLRHQTGG